MRWREAQTEPHPVRVRFLHEIKAPTVREPRGTRTLMGCGTVSERERLCSRRQMTG